MEEWTSWEPIQGLPKTFCILDLHMSHDGVRLLLQDEQGDIKVEVSFDGQSYGYRITNESLCFDIFTDLKARYGTKFCTEWSLFKIKNSEYLKWVSSKTSGLTDHLSLEHFCILGNDEIIDILSMYQPQVRIIA